jgi:hypothetical protein
MTATHRGFKSFALATTEPVGICPASTCLPPSADVQPASAQSRRCRALPRTRPPGAVTF